MQNYLKKIIFLLGDDKKKLPFFFMLFIMLSFLDVIGIGLIGPYISIVTDSGKADIFIKTLESYLNREFNASMAIYLASIILLSIFVIKTIFGVLINKLIINFGASQQIRLRTFLMKSYQSLPYQKYTNRNSSDYLFNIQQLVPQYSQKILVGGIRAMCEAMVITCILIFLAITNFVAFIMISAVFIALLLAYDFVIKKRLIVYGEKANLAGSKTMQSINEGIEGLKEIRILQKEDFFYRRVKKQTTNYANFYALSAFFQSIPKYLLELSMIIFLVLFVMLSISFGQNTQDLLPVLGMLGVAAIRLVPSINILSVAISSIRFAKDGIHRLYDDYAELTKLPIDNLVSEKTKENQADNFKSLELKNISFKYQNSKINALNSITFNIKRGDSIGLIGPSGSGKTTLVDIILGLYKPTEGEILFNGKPLNKNIKQWRENVAYLPQQVFLFDDSIKNNIAIGKSLNEIDQNKLEDAIRKASLKNLIEELPEGENTLIGERGIRLSGGQRQRIAIARAFYMNKDIIILDESTSALDTSTEEAIVNEIEEQRGDKTLITIAHRISTLRYCDKILSIKNGGIISLDTYEDLIKN